MEELVTEWAVSPSLAERAKIVLACAEEAALRRWRGLLR